MRRPRTRAERRVASRVLVFVAPACLLFSLPVHARQRMEGTLPRAAGPSLRVGPWQLAVEPAEPERGLRIFDRDGPVLLFEGARPVDLVLTGETQAPEIPAVAGRLRVRSDAGEELVLDLPGATVSRDPLGKRFTSRYRIDLSGLRQPFQRLRLEGELCAPQPLRLVTQRIEWVAGKESAIAPDAGPLRVALAIARAAAGGDTLTATCEWLLSGPAAAAGIAPAVAPLVAGPVTAELRLADGTPCPLLHTVAIDAARGETVQRAQKLVWRLEGAERALLTLSYPVLERERRPFVLDGVQLPAEPAPAVGRIAAQRLVLGDGWDRLLPVPEEPLPAAGPEPPAPNPLLDAEHGGTLRFHLRLESQPAGEGSVSAAFSPREGRAWGAWRWFGGRTDRNGEALFQNLRPGTYRVRVFFHPTTSRGILAEYRVRESQVTVPSHREVMLPATDLEPAR